MHVRKFKSDKNALLKEGQAIVSESADNKFVHRVSMVNLMLAGISAETLSQYFLTSSKIVPRIYQSR